MRIDWSVFSFPFSDPRWKSKVAIGAALALVGTNLWFPFFFLLLPVGGYALRIMRRTASGEPPSLPEWDDWGELFSDGLKMWVVSFVYLLPVLVVFCCVYSVWLGAGFGMPFLIGRTPRAVQGSFLVFLAGMYGVTFLLFAVGYLLAIPLGLLTSAALGRLAVTGSLGKAFEFGQVWGLLRRGFKNYMLAALVYLAAAFVAAFLAQISVYTIILCCLYPFLLALATFYIQSEMGALFGMAYYHTTNPAAEPAPAPAAAEIAPVVTAKDTDPTLKTDPLLKTGAPPTEMMPAAEPPAPKKRRASTPRKPKSPGGESPGGE